ncbi:MAG TPA: bifunctional serine/threonine-protein kinase/formylglycine-generating enzyme family protein, partial [Kofleriaceae bacterium]|nr:bifunctional serine/threonine-protein kinase/formylglycine-generating enzyme family protein [Kofleriaceae bacterium]
ARDVVLGRSVALKIVGPSKTGGFQTERFLHEARAIARLNHPHVVQLYDFGEYKGGLYLALEYVEGGTLRERAAQGSLAIDEVLRHARAIADGLAHAHAQGVYHCDLKPSNVMIGKDGRVRVVDFGIARTGENAVGTTSGTPDWMAPEQWTGAPATDRTDSWALGLVIAQLLTGKHPLGDTTAERRAAACDVGRVSVWKPERSDVPTAVIDLITRSLDHAARQRPSAAEWARVLDTVILDGRSDAAVEDGPYRGLQSFDEKHARFYFGRELEIDAFLERLRDAPHLPIVGPSGAGKSSFLHAGVIPRLRAREPWTVIAFRPGGDPVGALARHVLAAINHDLPGDARPSEAQLKAQIQAFRAELLETPTLLAARLATLAHVHGGRVLLAVDQLEEAFTQGAGEAERQHFLHMLLAAADDPLDPVRVVVTVRDDFVGKLAGLRSLFVVKKLGIDDIRRTITGPLGRYDYQFDDPAIVEDLIAEVGSAEATNLPLLSFACRTLWDGRDIARRRLLRATYREMGGLAGALARHADHALAELSPNEHRLARQLLLQLVVGTTRRSVARDQLIGTTGPGADAVLDRLLAARLLTQRNQGDGEAPIIEIAHESLVQTWSALARWLDESREERRLLEELLDAARLWERRGKRPEDTWSEADLATTRHRAAQLGLVLPPRIEEFFAAGDRRHQARRQRRRLRYGIGLGLAFIAAIPTFLMIGKYLTREQLIQNNMGTVDLVVVPFDWAGSAAVPAGTSAVPQLSLTLYGADGDDLNTPGKILSDSVVRILSPSDLGMLRTQRIYALGGTVFLKLDGRGRPGETCAPSWIRIQAFPGYRTNDVKSIVLWVPTCRATLANTVTIPEGKFLYGGPGDPRSRLYGTTDHTESERIVELQAFAIDRTEVSNAAFTPFAQMAHITGYPVPEYINDTDNVHLHDADPGYPVTYVDAYEAKAYCAYMGKRLPSDFQWTKAARGGLALGGKQNPAPARLYPWGNVVRTDCVNLAGAEDGYPWTAPVESFRCGASPYGVLHLVGNVQEWISREGQTDHEGTLHVLRGGGPDATDIDLTTTIFRNPRVPRAVEYSNGVRCVIEPQDLP